MEVSKNASLFNSSNKFLGLIRYLSGIYEPIAYKLPDDQLVQYSWIGIINILLALILIPSVGFAVNFVFGLNLFLSLIIGIILFIPYLFVLRFVSGLQIRNVVNRGIIIPIITFSLFFYLILAILQSISLFSLASVPQHTSQV